MAASFALLLLVGLTLPHAASPALGPRGWAPGTLLPITLSPAAVTAALWTAYVLGAAGVALALWRGRSGAPTPPPALSRPLVAVLAVGAALTAPFGSADHVNYAAYGRILSLGDDPWLVSPNAWRGGTDPVVSRVEAPWTEEPSVYGPFATLLHGLTALGGGDNLRETVWLWQLVIIASWLAVRWCLRRILPGREGRIDVLWTANPLVYAVGVLGAHVDMVATAAGVAAVWAIQRHAGRGGAALAGAFAALALSSKFTYAVVLVALLLALLVGSRASVGPVAQRVWRAVCVLVAASVVTGMLHLWAGPHVYDQIERSARAVSLATPWRWVLEQAGGGVAVRERISVLAVVAAVLFALALSRLVRPADAPQSATTSTVATRALAWVVILAGGYAFAAPYALPWYDVIVWAALPGVAAGVTDRLFLARLWIMAMAYTPGRVLGMTEGVEDLTMTVRSRVAPLLLVALWLWVIRYAVRAGSWPPLAGRRRGFARRH